MQYMKFDESQWVSQFFYGLVYKHGMHLCDGVKEYPLRYLFDTKVIVPICRAYDALKEKARQKRNLKGFARLHKDLVRLGRLAA